MTSHFHFGPFALSILALLVVAAVATSPRWKTAARHRRLRAYRHARVAEDAAWQHREEEAELARRIRFARYDREQLLGTGSLRALVGDVIEVHYPDFVEVEIGLGEIDGGGE